MEILHEIIECAEQRRFGPGLGMLRAELGDDELVRTAGHLLIILDSYIVPVAGRQVFANLKQRRSLQRMIATIRPLADFLEVGNNADIFKEAVSQKARDQIVGYVRAHWHPIVETSK
jgi:hypothetical protein